MKPKTVLIVHEEESLGALITGFRPLRPVSIVHAKTPFEAKRLFRGLRPDLVIAHFTTEWIPLLENFRSEQALLQVIALTPSDEAAERARRMGFDNVLIEETIENVAEGIQCFLGEWLTAPLQPDQRSTILVVDDDLENCNMLAGYLGSRGYGVLPAHDGRMALDILEKHPAVTVAVLDLVMPEMGGMETMKRMKSRARNLGVIIMSDFADREIVRQAFKLGAFDVLLKPLDLSQLETEISACVASQEFRNRPWWRWTASSFM